MLLVDINNLHVTCRGNWWGSAPYKHGTPCSACPPSYGGRCKNNQCYKGTSQHLVVVKFSGTTETFSSYRLEDCEFEF